MPSLQSLLDQVESSTNEIVELEQALVRIPSINTGFMPTGNETAVAEFTRDWIAQDGLDSEILSRDPDRGNIISIYPGDDDKTRLMLMSHTDVVPVSKGWSSDPFKAAIKNDKLYGRGSCDMKGFIACVLAYAPILSNSNLDTDIHFSFTFDEETACKGAPILIKELKKRGITNGICIVGEPTNMKIIDSHKGCYEYTTYFEGLAGHSSQPDKGVSAVEYAARYVNKLIELRQKLIDRAPKDSIFDPPYSTLQIGGVFGGIAHNVIADKCFVNWETRPVVKELSLIHI